MKKLISIVVLLFSLVAYSQEANKLFAEANTFYKEENFERSLGVYLSIEEQGLESSNLYFNIANCYYKLNKVAPSIYYYEKALKLDPAHAEATTNLAFAKRMTIDVIEELPKTFLQRFSKNIIQKWSFDTWAVIAVVASFTMALLFLLYYFSGGTKSKLLFFNTAILSFFIVLITVFFAYSNYSFVKNNKAAIIFSSKAEIKNAPTASGEEVFELHEGTKVTIIDELDNWKKIKINDGKIGWISSKDLKEI
ncbi:Tetratricopeptide repeat-containing protein [Lutibacter oricola]|uniref:Tetratricopeptide repeat-containing protein n=1 Tax=Lutibacter oricola TaxID=762486 RepID=A0A1H3D3J1_9FLAO|nr:SH3 domain-containing protein [Lutibacter oricola]SDX60945.1 Tetratricopeptide repeat-containing protein [Lutibacter oricola]